MQSHLDWGPMVYGILALALGLLFALSSGFAAFVLKNDGRSRIWTGLFGGGIQTRYVVSLFAIGVGALCIYLGFHPEK
jgi:hypothetical protein